MKKLALFFSALLAVFMLNAQVTPTVFFSENFDNAQGADDALNLPDWIIDTVQFENVSQYHIWKYYDDNTIGSGVASMSSYKMIADTVEAWLITPAVKMENTGNPLKLAVDVFHKYGTDNQLRILVTTDTPKVDDYKDLNWDTLAYNFPATGDYQHYDFDLSNYADTTIFVAFVYNGDNDDATALINIDNVVLEDVPPVPLLTDAYTYNDTTIIAVLDKDASSYSVTDFKLNDDAGVGLKSVSFNSTGDTATLITDGVMPGDTLIDTLTFSPSASQVEFYGGVLPLEMVNPASKYFVGIGKKVAVRGIVEYIISGSYGPKAYVIYDGKQGSYDAMLVYDATAANANVGDSILLNATSTIFYSLPELKTVTQYTILGLCDVNPQPLELDDQSIFSITYTDATQEPMNYIFSLVKLNNVSNAQYEVQKAFSSFWKVSDQNGNDYYIDDQFYDANDATAFDALFDQSKAYNVVGFLGYTYGHYTINPRNSSDVTVFVADVKDVAGVQVYPNPATDYLFVTGKNINRYEIQNVAGQTIKSKNVNGQNIQINVSDLTPGIYMLRVYTDKGIAIHKIIKK